MRVVYLARVLLVGAVFGAVLACGVAAQQPFFTDDADVQEKGTFNLEVSNEFDRLQFSELPETYQNVVTVTVAYGLTKHLEISIEGQGIGLFSTEDPRFVRGVGDTTLGAKYNFLEEREGSRRPALTVAGYIQFPTGNPGHGLGSGVADYGVNLIGQKTLGKKNTLRLNGGYLFAGNTLEGELGISSIRGHIFTGGASYVRRINEKWQLGAELTGAVTGKFELSEGQLQTQFGGNYQINKKMTFDFGFIVGRFAASPRYGFVLGFSRDF